MPRKGQGHFWRNENLYLKEGNGFLSRAIMGGIGSFCEGLCPFSISISSNQHLPDIANGRA